MKTQSAARTSGATPWERRLLLALLLACSASACTGDGEEVPEEPGPPVETPPPGPTPPGSADNQPPQAKAGEDRTTVEEQDVTLDGSRSTDPDNDPLVYRWQLSSAPPGSGLAVSADGPTLVFRPDLPGTYELQLTVNDGLGESADTVRVRADPLLAVDGEIEFSVDLNDKRGRDDDEREELDVETSGHYEGPPVAFTVTADVPWLRVLNPSGTTAAPGDEVTIAVELVRDEAEKLPGGDHEGRVQITPSGGWEQTVAVAALEVKRRGADSLVPNVAYMGEASSVMVYGEGLLQADGAPVFVDETAVALLKAISDERASIDLPALQAGEHELRIGDGLAVSGDTLRLVVRDKPVHSAAQLALRGAVRSLDYSAELDAFFAVLVRDDGTRVAERLRHSDRGDWLSETLGVNDPWALALTADGTEVLVSAEGCTVHSLDAGSLAVLESRVKPGCIPEAERFGVMATLADGRIIAVDDLGDSASWSYPQLTPMRASARLEDPPILNADRDRLTWSAGLLYAVPRDAENARSFVAPSGTAVFKFTADDAFSVHALD